MCVSVFVHVWRLNLCPTVSITVQQTAELCKVAMISIYGYLLLLLLWVTSRVVAAVQWSLLTTGPYLITKTTSCCSVVLHIASQVQIELAAAALPSDDDAPQQFQWVSRV